MESCRLDYQRGEKGRDVVNVRSATPADDGQALLPRIAGTGRTLAGALRRVVTGHAPKGAPRGEAAAAQSSKVSVPVGRVADRTLAELSRQRRRKCSDDPGESSAARTPLASCASSSQSALLARSAAATAGCAAADVQQASPPSPGTGQLAAPFAPFTPAVDRDRITTESIPGVKAPSPAAQLCGQGMGVGGKKTSAGCE